MKTRYLYLLFLHITLLQNPFTSQNLFAMPSAALAEAQTDEHGDEGAPLTLPTNQDDPATSSPHDEGDEGPDTTIFPEDEIGIQGNWVKKKYWLEKSYALRNKINAIAVEIQSARTLFDEQYSATDQELDNFYKQLCLNQGQLQEIFDGLERYLNKKKKQSLDMVKSEHSEEDKTQNREMLVKIDLLEEQVTAHKAELEQLKVDMKSIEDLDKSLSDRLDRRDEKIDTALKEAVQAEEITKKLWQIVNDKLARNQYFHLEHNVVGKLESIRDYLRNDLYQDFQQVTNTIKNQISKADQAVKKLEAKGFIIQDRTKRIKAIKLKKVKNAEKEAQEAAENAVAPQPKLSKKKTWYTTCYDFVIDSIVAVINFFKQAYAQVLGVSPKPKVQTIKKEVQPLEPAAEQPAQTSSMPQQMPAPQQAAMPQAPAPVAQPMVMPTMPAMNMGGMPRST